VQVASGTGRAHGHDHLDLDSEALRQLLHADRRPGVAAGSSEDVDNRSDAPSMTWGSASNAGVQATKPVTLTIASTSSNEPSAARV
jgi:hypothetical protein